MTVTFWNGQPVPAMRGTAVVAPAPQFPSYWASDLVGTRIPVVEVLVWPQLGDEQHRIYLDDRVGDGWRKVTEGHGGPAYPHRGVEIDPGSFIVVIDSPRSCRFCRCTDADCTDCIARTGEPCAWIHPDLDICSACLDSLEGRITALDELAKLIATKQLEHEAFFAAIGVAYHAIAHANLRAGLQTRHGVDVAAEGEENCGAVDPDEGACILVPGHDGGCWYSMFGKPRA